MGGRSAAADEDSLFDVISHLPHEAQEAILRLAVGEKPEPPKPLPVEADPFTHPDAQRRFRVLTNFRNWSARSNSRGRNGRFSCIRISARWSNAASTAQRASRARRAPARRSSRCTAPSIWRAARRKRECFSRPSPHALANALRANLGHLVGNEPAIAARITVEAINDLARRLYTERFGVPSRSRRTMLSARCSLKPAQSAALIRFGAKFLLNEWTDVVDAWNLQSWEAYRDVPRLGRKTRIGGKQREQLWAIFSALRAALESAA